MFSITRRILTEDPALPPFQKNFGLVTFVSKMYILSHISVISQFRQNIKKNFKICDSL